MLPPATDPPVLFGTLQPLLLVLPRVPCTGEGRGSTSGSFIVVIVVVVVVNFDLAIAAALSSDFLPPSHVWGRCGSCALLQGTVKALLPTATALPLSWLEVEGGCFR